MTKWKMVQLGEICYINPKKSEIANVSDDLEVSFVPMQKVSEEGRMDTSECRTIRNVKKGFTYFRDGDVLFAKITPCMENGKGAVAKNLKNGIGFGSTEFHVLRPIPNISDSQWLFYATVFDNFRKNAEKIMTGTAGQKRVPASFLDSYLVPVPPLEVQRRIAAALDQAIELIALRRRQLEKLDLMVKAKFVEMFGDPVTNPMGWERGLIRDIVSDVKYGTSKPACDNGRFIYLRMNNITYDGHLDLTSLKTIDLDDNEAEKYLVQDGDVLFNRTNSKELVGKTCVFKNKRPMIIAGYIIRIRTNEKAQPDYLSAILNSKYGKVTLFNMCKAIIGQANINAQELQEIKILIPPLSLQAEFAAFVEQVEAQKALMQRGLAALELNYKALMQNYFG